MLTGEGQVAAVMVKEAGFGGMEEVVEGVTSRRTRTRRCVDVGRPSKSLWAVGSRHNSPSALV